MSKHFEDAELSCRCGCGLMPKEETIKLADRIREEWGSPLFCVSGARCAAHTEALQRRGIPARAKSAHNAGLALDLAPTDGRISAFHVFCQHRLERWEAWMESPAFTTAWAHIQLRPASKRVFDPGPDPTP